MAFVLIEGDVHALEKKEHRREKNTQLIQ